MPEPVPATPQLLRRVSAGAVLEFMRASGAVTVTDVMAATQKPLAGSVFEAKPTAAAWKDKPTWFIVAKDDHVINPDLERFFARRMGAKTTEVDARHVAFMSHPDVVVEAIEQAAA